MEVPKFFKTLVELLQKTAIPLADKEYVKQFSKFGLNSGKGFDTSTLSEEQIKILNEAVKKAQNQIKQEWNDHPFAKTENGWGIMLKDIGNYGKNYKVRAAVAFGGLGANLPEDAIYPFTNVDSTGQLLNGKFNYVVHFDKEQPPPVKAFWSLTMYDDRHFFVKNPINR